MTTNELISNEDDVVLRGYAKRLNVELGEDAYHNAVCDILHHKTEVQNILALGTIAIRRSLCKIFRHENTERKNIEHYINNDPVPAQRGLVHGWGVKLLKCRKGLHEMVESNLAYVGTRRTCLVCMQERLKRKRQR